MNGTNYGVPHCEAYSLSNSHPSWAPKICLGMLFLDTLSLSSSLNVKQSQPCSLTGNIIVLYILIIKFLEKSREDKNVWTE